MKPSTVLVLVFTSVCSAKNGWTLKECDESKSKALRAAIPDAIEIAGTAVRVLNEQFHEEKIQKMAKLILGDDNEFQGKLDKVKGDLQYVASIRQDEDTSLDAPGPDVGNTDVIIYCDASNFEMRNDHQFNKVTNTVVREGGSQDITDCYERGNEEDHDVPLVIAYSSDFIPDKYYEDLKDWVKGGRKGQMPDKKEIAVSRPEWANTLNICKWYIEAIIGEDGEDDDNEDDDNEDDDNEDDDNEDDEGDEGDEGDDDDDGFYLRLDDATIAKTQTSAYLKKLQGTQKPIDPLADSLAGTLLHELTHTIPGGRSIDVDAAGGCYFWDCVIKIHQADNADSITMLGISMYLFSKGYWVDEAGAIHSI